MARWVRNSLTDWWTCVYQCLLTFVLERRNRGEILSGVVLTALLPPLTTGFCFSLLGGARSTGNLPTSRGFDFHLGFLKGSLFLWQALFFVDVVVVCCCLLLFVVVVLLLLLLLLQQLLLIMLLLFKVALFVVCMDAVSYTHLTLPTIYSV